MTEIAFARPSSTVVLVRPAVAAPELFMVRRHARSSFGAAYAFPGGVVDPEDHAVHDHCAGITAKTANANLGVREGGLDYYSAAIRELFEESGVLLADPNAVDEALDAVRDALNDRSDNWADFVKRNGLALQCDRLYYFSHWITPTPLRKRYSTRFFLAVMPDEQMASHCGWELTDSCWINARDALAAGRAGDIKLHFPTIKTLESIARHKTFDDLVEWASSCVEWGVTSILAKIIDRDGREEIVLPGEIGYPGTEA